MTEQDGIFFFLPYIKQLGIMRNSANVKYWFHLAWDPSSIWPCSPSFFEVDVLFQFFWSKTFKWEANHSLVGDSIMNLTMRTQEKIYRVHFMCKMDVHDKFDLTNTMGPMQFFQMIMMMIHLQVLCYWKTAPWLMIAGVVSEWLVTRTDFN